ncbi:MAG: hypothetical protein R3B12_00320 [Candidatus Saccharimonadales bacterium]
MQNGFEGNDLLSIDDTAKRIADSVCLTFAYAASISNKEITKNSFWVFVFNMAAKASTRTLFSQISRCEFRCGFTTVPDTSKMSMGKEKMAAKERVFARYGLKRCHSFMTLSLCGILKIGVAAVGALKPFCACRNSGEGAGEHPTRLLLDTFTIQVLKDILMG